MTSKGARCCLGELGAELDSPLFFFLTTQTTMTTRSRKTETDKQMTKMRTGKGSSVGFEPPDGGTTLFGKTAESRKETEKIRVFCFKP